MRISDWSSDVCSSDLHCVAHLRDVDMVFTDAAAPARLTRTMRDNGVQLFVAETEAEPDSRPEEGRVGKECDRRCRSRWSPSHYQKRELNHSERITSTLDNSESSYCTNIEHYIN